MIDNELIPYGVGMKYSIDLAAMGFDMDSDTWRIELKGASGTSTVIDKSACIVDDKGVWYFVFDSAALGPGLIRIRVVATIVDYDFPDGTRDEVWEDNLCRVGRPAGCGMS